MSASRITSSLFLLIFTLLLQEVIGAYPFFGSCSGKENSTAKYISYQTSLNILMRSFYHLAPAKEGFALGSLGQNNQDQIYGLVLCRGDVSSSDCRTCVANATREIPKVCPNKKRVMIWYNFCLLKYSDSNFFGQIDTGKSSSWKLQNVSNPVVINKKPEDLLSQLAALASYNTTKMYAAGEVDLEGSEKLYGLVQCTRDLSMVNCKQCLDDGISHLQSSGKVGGSFLSGSCMVRYEIYRFFKA